MLPLKDNVPTRSFPIVTVALIVANVLVFVWELTAPGLNEHVFQAGFYPCTVNGPCVTPAPADPLPWYEGAFSSMFVHAGWEHIIGNMLFLWIFGNNVEDALGKVKFLAWYVAAGLAAALAQSAVTLAAGNAQDASIPSVGASGAIAGVLGAYFVLLPTARVLTLIFLGFVFFVEVPAVLFLGVWIALQIWTGGLSLLSPTHGGGVAFFAHIGGFVFGLLTIRMLVRRPPVQPSYR